MLYDDLSSKLCAVIITYNPDRSLLTNVESIMKEVGKVIIVDNASNIEEKTFIEKISSQSERIFAVYNKKNLGIATALNQAIKLATELNYEWVITLDQDSIFAEEAVQKMLVFANSRNKLEDIGLIAPSYCYEGLENKKLSSKPLKGNEYIEPFVVITSGSLIRLKVFQDVGLFADEYFIDYVDYEFCLRLRSNGYRIYQISNAHLFHRLGNPGRINFLGCLITYSIHSSTRIYFKYRNRFLTYKLYFFKFPTWCIKDAFEIPKELLKILLFDFDRIKSLKSAAKGVFSAFFAE
jgi:rhamnosyltransferase